MTEGSLNYSLLPDKLPPYVSLTVLTPDSLSEMFVGLEWWFLVCDNFSILVSCFNPWSARSRLLWSHVGQRVHSSSLEYMTDWLTGWLADWLTDWLTDWLNDWLIGWQTVWLAVWLTDWLAGLLTDLLSDLQTDWLTCWPTDWQTDWLINWIDNILSYWESDRVINHFMLNDYILNLHEHVLECWIDLLPFHSTISLW